MKHFDSTATREPLDFARLVPALRAAFAAEAQVPPRHVHAIETAGAGKGTVLIMPAWSDAGFLGIKTINIFPGNSARGLPGLHATYVLYDARTGVPLAMMDGNELTARRTAAASALGASFLARADARRLLVLGTGRVARLLPAAHASVRPIGEVLVWNHRPEGAQALAAQWRAEGFNAQAATGLEAAVRQADIVSCATLATAPLVRGEWLAPGSHLDLIGSFTPAMREADVRCFGVRAPSSTPPRRCRRPASCSTPSRPARCAPMRCKARWPHSAGANARAARAAKSAPSSRPWAARSKTWRPPRWSGSTPNRFRPKA